MDDGYLYVLINPSIEGNVKIGTCKQDPASILDELTKEPNVATNSTLVYRDYVERNCEILEKEIYRNLLESYSVQQDDLGFLKVEPYEAIECIQKVKSSPLPISHTSSMQNDIPKRAFELFDEACNYYYGRGSTVQDYREAENLFKQSSELGVLPSYIYLGRIYEYGDGGDPNIKKALEYYEAGVRSGSNVCNAKIACLYWRDTEIKDIEIGKKYWKTYFKQLDHSIITKDDYANFSFYLSLSKENHLEIDYKDILGAYKKPLLKLLQIRKDVCLEQHAGNQPFRDYMLSIIHEEMDFVDALAPVHLEDGYSNFAISSDLLHITNMGTILLADVERGAFHVGDDLEISAPGISVKSTIKKIDKYGQFIEKASEGDSVGFLVTGSEEELKFVKLGASILKSI
ncbi:hypothetical protein QA612_11220 [Evansella sp. AB-P1]|uniref:hypothetical protein n=1 Tax=Evansella sp. AB-P1 TaxID=3037653 RepID=UPI00241DBB1F|nr:hypothetical protein [Evansella sp. AB-P1]MDG5788061.1 hypothetical protein [Evansella sp. AB-P1]